MSDRRRMGGEGGPAHHAVCYTRGTSVCLSVCLFVLPHLVVGGQMWLVVDKVTHLVVQAYTSQIRATANATSCGMNS